MIKIVVMYSLPTTFTAAILYVVLITILLVLLTKISFFQKLTNPYSLL